MADLRTLLYTNTAVPGLLPAEILVFNTNIDTPLNGGRCCLFTVPGGATWVTFDIWGGGGGGAGSCCCMQGRSGGSGSYSRKTVNSATLAGCQYTICAAGTTGAAPGAVGCVGNTSFVTGFGLTSFCARGGCSGATWCWGYCACSGLGRMENWVCCATGGDIDIHGIDGGGISSTYCFANGKQWAPVAPMTISGPFFGPGGCQNGGMGEVNFCGPVFPGGAGLSAQAYGGSCWCGQMGAGGLVLVSYG